MLVVVVWRVLRSQILAGHRRVFAIPSDTRSATGVYLRLETLGARPTCKLANEQKCVGEEEVEGGWTRAPRLRMTVMMEKNAIRTMMDEEPVYIGLDRCAPESVALAAAS